MNRSLLLVLGISVALVARPQGKSAATKAPAKPATAATADPVLMTVDGAPVLRSEFEAIYKKNNKDASVTKEALDEYLDLFINYKLKVRAAEVEGLDTVSKFKNELDGYRKQLARPYLIDRELNDELIREAYERSQEEVKASHILVTVAADASPADTLAAWKRISALRARVVAGEDFGAVAAGKGGSDDPSASANNGQLGWFSVLQMVYPFEVAAYSTPVGSISQPVRTRFGYHVIKVEGRRPAQGEVKVAHIMVRSTDKDDATKQAAAVARINEAHGKVVSGEMTFNDAALRYSDDDGTNSRGGELPMFGTGKMIEEFETQAFAMAKDGDISKPFRTAYGWHVIKRLERKTPPTFEAAKGDLRGRIAKDSRAEITRKKFLAGLRKDYGYKAFPKELKALEKTVDGLVFARGNTTVDTLLRKDVEEGIVTIKGAKYDRAISGQLRNGKVVGVHGVRGENSTPSPDDTLVVRNTHQGWLASPAVLAKSTATLFVLDGHKYDQAGFLRYLESQQRAGAARPMGEYLAERFDAYVDEQVLAYEDSRLEGKYPEFKLLMKEYRDGILLFELTDRVVWSKAVKDTVGLAAFHAEHEMDHMYPVRYQGAVYTAKDAAAAKALREQYRKGKRAGELLSVVNKKRPNAVTLEEGIWSAEQKPVFAGLTLPGLGNDRPVEDGIEVVDLVRVLQPSPKPLTEVRGQVTAAYQDHLEKEWIKELRAKYPVRVEQDVLHSIR